MTLFHFLGNLLFIAGSTYLGNKYITATPKAKTIANQVIAAATAAYSLKTLGLVDVIGFLQSLNIPVGS